MRQKFHLSSLSLIAGLLLCCALNGIAQNREKFVISAKAGGINAVTGQASMHAKGEADWQQLMITDDLEAGDRVRTAYDGRVEILLNPGSYLRLGGNSEVELSNNSLANLEVRLIRGTAIVEATGVEETQLLINISTPHARMAIDRQGLYRLNVVPNDATELIVRKGRVILGDTNTKIKGGNKVVFFATAVSIAKLTDQDKKLEKTIPVESWSKDRAEMLAKANRRINNRMLTSAFASFNSNDFFYGFRRSGFWFYNSSSSCYTFLPFGYTNSPYGASYPTTIYGGYGYTGGGRGYPPVAGGSNGSYPGGTGGTASGGNGGSGGGYSPAAPVRTMPSMPAPSAPSMAAPRDPDSGQRVRATPERP